MARKKKHEEHENHERWLVSYADFITLLFAFFVVMYSISSVNEGKFRVVSQSIVEALNPLIPMSASTLRFQPDNQGGATSNRAISIDMQVYKKLSEAIKAIDARARQGDAGRARRDDQYYGHDALQARRSHGVVRVARDA